MRRNVVRCILMVAVALAPVLANAGSIPITGTALLDGSDITDVVTGGPLSLLTQAPSGPNLVGGPLNPGLVNFTLDVPMFSAINGGFASVTFGNQSTDMVLGGLIFSGTFTVPTQPNGTGFTVTFPVTMIGNGIAYQDLSGTKGPQIFDLAFNGSGIVTVQGVFVNGQYYVDSGAASFNGSATVVPEPSSVLLLGTGLAGIVGMRRKLRASFSLALFPFDEGARCMARAVCN
jgi:PEP-CTERM motif